MVHPVRPVQPPTRAMGGEDTMHKLTSGPPPAPPPIPAPSTALGGFKKASPPMTTPKDSGFLNSQHPPRHLAISIYHSDYYLIF